MLYEIGLFAAGFVTAVIILLYIGWRTDQNNIKRHSFDPFSGRKNGWIFVTIREDGVYAAENSHLKGVDEVDKAGLTKDELEEKR